MPKTRRKWWSKNLHPDGGRRIRIYEHPESSAIWCSVIVDQKKVRRSLKTDDRTVAEDRAKAISLELAKDDAWLKPTGDIRLGQLFSAYRQHHLPTLSKARQCEAEARITMFTEAWGADLLVVDVDATRVRSYCAARRSLQIVAPGKKPDETGNWKRGYQTPRPIRDGGLDGEFRWLNSVFNWACGFKMEGRPLLDRNPLPSRGRDRRAIGWPVESNPLRPVASHHRYLSTMKHVDEVDPKGRLRCILALARYTGRRESAICAIQASDLLLSKDRIRDALADAGMDEGMAEHMPHGAIRWAAASDKLGFLFISPISQHARDAIDVYLRANPRMGDVPLFPAPGPRRKKKTEEKAMDSRGTAENPISRHTAAKWLLRAEEAAGLPKLRGGVFHPYRRLWATERKNLPDVDVAHAGGWGDTQALRLSYQKADPVTVLRVVENGH